MSPIDKLLIRACKSENPKKRLRSVYRRFYLRADDKVFRTAMIAILSRIIEGQRLPYRLYDILVGVDPKSGTHGYYDGEYDEHVLDTVIGIIRYASREKFSDLSWTPKRFRSES